MNYIISQLRSLVNNVCLHRPNRKYVVFTEYKEPIREKEPKRRNEGLSPQLPTAIVQKTNKTTSREIGHPCTAKSKRVVDGHFVSLAYIHYYIGTTDTISKNHWYNLQNTLNWGGGGEQMSEFHMLEITKRPSGTLLKCSSNIFQW